MAFPAVAKPLDACFKDIIVFFVLWERFVSERECIDDALMYTNTSSNNKYKVTSVYLKQKNRTKLHFLCSWNVLRVG